MQLGTLITRLQSEQDAGLALEALGDLALFTEIAEMASRFDETPATYVACAAARFANLAGHEDWVTVVGAAGSTTEPGRAVLARMLRWALTRDQLEWQTG